jgi:hypothetical protein
VKQKIRHAGCFAGLAPPLQLRTHQAAFPIVEDGETSPSRLRNLRTRRGSSSVPSATNRSSLQAGARYALGTRAPAEVSQTAARGDAATAPG